MCPQSPHQPRVHFYPLEGTTSKPQGQTQNLLTQAKMSFMHSSLRISTTLALLAGAALAPVGLAQNVPAPIRVNAQLPSDLFRLEGEHFTVIASSLNRAVGESVLEAAEKVRQQVIELVGNAPPRVTILLDNGSDAFNGFAAPAPFPVIRVFATFPQPYQIGLEWGSLWEDLLSHEYTHIAHLGQRSEFQASVAGIFGNLPIPGLTQAREAPAWFIEGLAVWVESQVTQAGRLQDPYSALVVAQNALEGSFPSLSDVSISPFDTFPFGNARYLYGGRFVDFLVRSYGKAKIPQLLAAYNTAVPWVSFSQAWEQVAGHPLETDWAAFATEELEQAKQNPAPPTALSQAKGSYAPLAWDGRHLAWWGGRALNIAEYIQTPGQAGKLEDIQRFELDSRPTSMVWDSSYSQSNPEKTRLIYSRNKQTSTGAVGEVFSLEVSTLERRAETPKSTQKSPKHQPNQSPERQLSQGARALLVASDGGKIYYVRESECFPIVPPQDGCNSSVLQLSSDPNQESRRIIEFEQEHILSLDVQDGKFLIGRWISGGEHLFSVFQNSWEAPLELPKDALDAHWSDQGQIIYTSASWKATSSRIPQIYQLVNSSDSSNVDSNSDSSSDSSSGSLESATVIPKTDSTSSSASNSVDNLTGNSQIDPKAVRATENNSPNTSSNTLQTNLPDSENPLLEVGGGSFSGRYADGKLAYLNLTAGGFVPVITELELQEDPMALQEMNQNLLEQRPSVYFQPTRIVTTLGQNWQPYTPTFKAWGWIPLSSQSSQAIGITAFAGDPTGNLSAAGSVFLDSTTNLPGAAATLRLQLTPARALEVWGNTSQAVGVRLEQKAILPRNVALTLTPQVYWGGNFGVSLGLELDKLARDNYGYASAGFQVKGSFDLAGIGYQAIVSAAGFTALFVGRNRSNSLEANYHFALPLKWRYSDGFAGLERLSLLPTVGLFHIGAYDQNLYGGAGIYLDGNYNYALPFRLGVDLLYGSRGGFGVRMGSSITLPTALGDAGLGSSGLGKTGVGD